MTYHPEQNRLLALFHGAHTRILDVVDAQIDFMHKEAALGIHPDNGSKQDASEIIAPLNAFFEALPEHAFAYAFVKFDTHFRGEYPFSPESQLFPDVHCPYGEAGWNLAVNIDPLTKKYLTYMLAKNVFDMWGSNPTNVDRDRLNLTADEAKAYDNLFTFIRLDSGDDPLQRLATSTDAHARDAFIADHVDHNTVVVMCGVASDFCNYLAMLGYLQRGATVVIAEDLTRGIGGPASPAPDTGATRDVVAATLAANPAYADRLHLAQSADIISALRALSPAPVGHRPTKLILGTKGRKNAL